MLGLESHILPLGLTTIDINLSAAEEDEFLATMVQTATAQVWAAFADGEPVSV